MKYTYRYTCKNPECKEQHTVTVDTDPSEIGKHHLRDKCYYCGTINAHKPLTVQETLDKIMTDYPTLEKLGVLLDAPNDMFELGYIDNSLEQDVMTELSNLSFVWLWAVHSFVSSDRSNHDHEFSYDQLIVELIESLHSY